MLAIKRSVAVTPEVNLKNPEQTSPEDQKKSTSGPTKKICALQKKLNKKRKSHNVHTLILITVRTPNVNFKRAALLSVDSDVSMGDEWTPCLLSAS